MSLTRTEDHRTAAYSPPSGCRHCGIGQYVHAQRWIEATGWHGYEPPTADQMWRRMLRRRIRRGRFIKPDPRRRRGVW